MESGTKKLMKALADLFWKKYNVDLEQIISKKELGRILSAQRAEEISQEYKENRYKPKFKIEDILMKILEVFS